MAQGSRLLRWNGSRSSPREDRRNSLAFAAVEHVKGHDGPLKAGELQDLLPGRKADPKRRAIAFAVENGWLKAEPGPRNSTLYTVGDVNPHRIHLRAERGENQ
jgi:hypothetical protein